MNDRRAVNLGAANRIAMANLRRVSITDEGGATTGVIILTRQELATAVEENPLAAVATDPSRLLVMAFHDSRRCSRSGHS